MSGVPAASTCTLTNPNHELILPPGNLQWAPYIPPPEQRVEQRVKQRVEQRVEQRLELRVEQRVETPTLPPAPTITRITNALLIMAAPNPTTKHALRLTKCTHLDRMPNNIPGSVPPITGHIAALLLSIPLHPWHQHNGLQEHPPLVCKQNPYIFHKFDLSLLKVDSATIT